jgi:hypothetical protein
VQLGSLSTEVAGKQSQLRAGLGEDAHPFLVGTYDEDLVLKDTVRALRVSAPLVATQSPFVVDLSLDASIATQEGLDATNAQLLTTKNNVNSLLASSEALSGEVDALAAGLATKQGQLTPGTIAGGHQLLQGTTVRAIRGAEPVQVTATATHVEVALAQSYFDVVTTFSDAIATLSTEVAGKQDVLGFVPDEDPNSYQILQNGVIRALKVSSPLVATSDMSQVHVSLDPGWSPFFCAGVVNGATLSTVMSQGAVSFTVSRVPNYAAGVYKVTFASNHPRGSNYVVLVHSRNSNSYLTPVITEAPTPQTAAYFHVTLRNTTATALADEQFHFSVLA